MTAVDVGVIGGGPAGSVCALRLARLGHRVVLVERRPFPRPHVGEALSPGVRPLLDVLDLGHALDGALPSQGSLVRWEDTTTHLVPPDPRAVTVDRGRFDHALLAAARAAGVEVRQPVRAGRPRRVPSGWEIPLRHDTLHARFLVDASGRRRVTGGTTTAAGPRTLALHAVWPGTGPTRIGTGPRTWCWGASLPGGTFRAMAFLDPELLHRADPHRLLHHLLDSTGLFTDRPPTLDVTVCDATSYRADSPVTDDCVKVGEAAFTLDPLTSSGVDSALHSAMAAAVTVHTVLSEGDREAALAFYRDSRDRTAARHTAWTAAHYDRHQPHRDQPFWRRRAARPPDTHPPRPLTTDDLHRPVRLSADAAVVPTPCPVGDVVTMRRALTHPTLATPIAHVGSTELAPLLDCLGHTASLADLLRAWSAHLPARQAEATARWLFEQGLLVTG
ncbi:flavin-dependent dehydrogenase [Saccharothrix carnea]|uniref:Flavin-dependent dehydrogenase n=1 Tax=Saccharothrix carnea TaxID=1280637 RepID=A0A2P8IFC5_SACCR|nr:NAD(P)/FAD-dependent oxidoreductase [Saccharothrix carnea]PSL57171.1 flavin-dependent dehydrogenase [Saccharothrix carnea]